VTESEWLAQANAAQMVNFVREKASDRKLRLFACAYARQLLHRVGEYCCDNGLHAAEQLADGLIDHKDWFVAWRQVSDILMDAVQNSQFERAATLVYASRCLSLKRERLISLRYHFQGWQAADISMVRDIFGNPFRSRPNISDELTTWNNQAAFHLAEAAYIQRILPSGHLDPNLLNSLAHALAEAHCNDAELLTHLHSKEPHWRGCWAIDQILSKES
jgi:hypothetical protein